jgi:paired amphipathic helix protein Sin3a
LPEDEGDLSKAWERYIESFVGDTVTKGLPLSENELLRTVCLRRNLKTTKEADGLAKTQVLAKSELESRICMRSYRMFWQGKTEDAMHREWSESVETSKLEELENKRKTRFSKWLEKRNATLSEQLAARESSQAALMTEAPQSKEAEKNDDPAPSSTEVVPATETGDVTMEDAAPAESPIAKSGADKEAEKKEEPKTQDPANETTSATPAPAVAQPSA